ncbi:hypothetical protein PsorP6_014306 [Peronosclerospora sorghi]|uniref:Uncharacterized protein n=1 Tax=Peronosclerospora sorghi TaxID=230839 RepID=A0ACC0VJM1_9STRA|nr:hypothetical protein PsorP6_014306 [Peronosclerospora sorghi]
MFKSCDLLVLTLVVLANHIVVSALVDRAPLALAAISFDQSIRPSSDGNRLLREKDKARDAADEERELVNKKEFDPDDENHVFLLLQELGHKTNEWLELLLNEGGIAKDKIHGLLDLKDLYHKTFIHLGLVDLKIGDGSKYSAPQDDLFSWMNHYQVSPRGLRLMLQLDESFHVHGRKITPAFVDEYKKYVANLAAKENNVEGER